MAFIRHQITRLDEGKDSIVELLEGVTELRPSEAIPSPDAEPHFTLCAKHSNPKEKLAIGVGKLQAGSPTFDQAFTSFRSRVSKAIHEMSSEPSNAVQDSQEVIFIKVSILACFTMD